MSTIDIVYESRQDLRWLLGKCGVANGWGKFGPGFGYSGLGHAEYLGDRKIELRVQLVARTDVFGAVVPRELPGDLQYAFETDFAYGLMAAGVLHLRFPIEYILENAQPGRFEVVKLFDHPGISLQTNDSGWHLDYRSWLRVDAPRGPHARTTREFDTQFWQGGLPSLGKR
jgi:hypothetical protein